MTMIITTTIIIIVIIPGASGLMASLCLAFSASRRFTLESSSVGSWRAQLPLPSCQGNYKLRTVPMCSKKMFYKPSWAWVWV